MLDSNNMLKCKRISFFCIPSEYFCCLIFLSFIFTDVVSWKMRKNTSEYFMHFTESELYYANYDNVVAMKRSDIFTFIFFVVIFCLNRNKKRKLFRFPTRQVTILFFISHEKEKEDFRISLNNAYCSHHKIFKFFQWMLLSGQLQFWALLQFIFNTSYRLILQREILRWI